MDNNPHHTSACDSLQCTREPTMGGAAVRAPAPTLHAELFHFVRSPARFTVLTVRTRRVVEEDPGVPSPERRDADPDLAWGDTLLSPAVQDTCDTSPTMAPPPPRVRRMSREDTVGRDADRPPDIPQTRASCSCTPLSAHTSGLHAQHSCADQTAQTHGYCSSRQSRPHTHPKLGNTPHNAWMGHLRSFCSRSRRISSLM